MYWEPTDVENVKNTRYLIGSMYEVTLTFIFS